MWLSIGTRVKGRQDLKSLSIKIVQKALSTLQEIYTFLTRKYAIVEVS